MRYGAMLGKTFNTDSVLYHGDVVSWDNYIDGETAHELRTKIKQKNKKNNIIEYNIFGEKRSIHLPSASETIIERGELMNAKRYNAVVMYASENMIIDDRIVVFRKRFFEQYDLYNYQDCLYINYRTEKKSSTSISDIVGDYDDGQKSTEVNSVTTDDPQNDSEHVPNRLAMGFKKEFLEGFYRDEPLIIMGTEQYIAETKYAKDGKVHGVYMDKLRTLDFKDFSELSSRLTRPMSDCQYDMIYHLGQETWLGGARKIGKTAAIMSHIKGFGFSLRRSSRPIRIARLALGEEAHKSAKMYLRAMAGDFTDFGNIDESKSENTFSIQDVHLQKVDKGKAKEIKKKIAEIEVKYVSHLKMDKKVDLGGVYDLIVVDEADFISQRYYMGLMALVKQEGSQIIFMMNFNQEGKKTFAYKKFIEAEKEEFLRQARGETVTSIVNDIRDKYKLGSFNSLEELLSNVDMLAARKELRSRREKVGKRYSLRDNDMLTDQEKETTADYFRKEDYITYLTHYECVLPSERSIFELTNIRAKEANNQQYQLLIFTLDPSKNSEDPSAMTIWGYQNKLGSPFYNKLVGLEEMKIPGASVKSQIPRIRIEWERVLNKYLDPEMRMEDGYVFLHDPNGVGEGVREYLLGVGIKKVIGIHAVGRGIGQTEDQRVFRINKKSYVESAQISIADGLILLGEQLQETYRQLTIFEEQKTNTGLITYAAPQGDHDDFVTNVLMVNWFAVQHGIKNRFMMEKIKEIQSQVENINREENPLDRELKMQQKEKRQKQLKIDAQKKEQYYRKYLY